MRALFALCLGIALGSCGSDGKSQAQLCMEGSTTACDRIFDCPEGESLRTFVGGTKEACHQTVLEFCTCPAGQTYHADQAQLCADGLQATTCASLTDIATAVPAACSMVCTAAAP